MIERKDILSLEFLKKEVYTGSYQGMRYRLSKKQNEEITLLQVINWPEPYNYFHAEEESKESETFSFTEEGICQAIDWLNQEWSKRQNE
jgi:hypothetical protein